MNPEDPRLDDKDACEPYNVVGDEMIQNLPTLDELKNKVEAVTENVANAGFTEKAINQAAQELLPTLDEASTELAAKLGKRYEERLAMRKRMLEGLSPRGRFRKNAPCPCGSGKKFKKCHRRDFLDKKNGRRVDPTTTPDQDTTNDDHQI